MTSPDTRQRVRRALRVAAYLAPGAALIATGAALSFGAGGGDASSGSQSHASIAKSALSVLEAHQAAEAAKTQTVDFNDPLLDPNWLEGGQEHRAKVDPLMGKPAPPLKVDSWMNSKPLTWADLKGKTVLLFFWSPTCHTCQQVMPALNSAYQQLSGKGLEMIGVCRSDQARLYAQGVEHHGIPFPTALDQNNETWNAYGADGTPDFYIIDKEGVLRAADVKNVYSLQVAATYMGLAKPESPNK